MKHADKVLIAATIVAVGWAVGMAVMVPAPIGRLIAHDLVDVLQRAHPEEQAGRIAVDFARVFGDAIRDLILVAAVPALIVGGLWCVLAVARRNRSG